VLIWALLVAAAAVLAMPYLLGPWRVLRNLRTDRELRFEVVHEPFGAEVEADFARFADALERCGFRRVERWRSHSRATGQVAVALALCDETVGRWGVAYAILDAAGQPVHYYQDISCTLSDGGVLGVDSVKTPRIFAVPAGWRSFNFPQVADGELLCRLHDTALARFADGRSPRPLAAGDLRREVEELGIRHVRHQVEVGLLRPDGESLPPTVRGALVMTWKLLWPWRQLAARRRRRDAMLLLSFLEPYRGALAAGSRPAAGQQPRAARRRSGGRRWPASSRPP
jgi:hypothetical protein